MEAPRLCEDANQFLAAFRASQSNLLLLNKYRSSPKPAQTAEDEAVNSALSRHEDNVIPGPKEALTQRGSSILTSPSALATSATATTPYIAENQSSGDKMPPERREDAPESADADLSGDANQRDESNETNQPANAEDDGKGTK